MPISSGEQLSRQVEPEKHCTDHSSTPDKREELDQANDTHVVDPGVYAAVLDYYGVRIFVKRSSMTSSTVAKVGSQVVVVYLCHDRAFPRQQRMYRSK